MSISAIFFHIQGEHQMHFSTAFHLKFAGKEKKKISKLSERQHNLRSPSQFYNVKPPKHNQPPSKHKFFLSQNHIVQMTFRLLEFRW